MAPLAASVVGQQAASGAEPVTCQDRVSIIGKAPDGDLWLYPYTGLAGSTVSGGSRVLIGTGWQVYDRVLGGPDGRVYGINATGLYRYRWTGSTWESLGDSERLQLSTGFTEYATPTFRNRITVDERGDIFTVDADGRLRLHRYDESKKTWAIEGRVLDTGWSRYDLIAAAGPGVLYARTREGVLHRYRIDTVSQRWLVRETGVGTGWGMFPTGLFSVGGDMLLGVTSGGDLLQYWYHEETATWEVAGRRVGTGWGMYQEVLASTNACRVDLPVPPPTSTLPIAQRTPLSVIQATPVGGNGYGSVDLAYTNNRGGLSHARIADPNVLSDIVWLSISGNDAFTGRPPLASNEHGTVQVFGHHIRGNV